jgi:hypothetical protein
MDSFSHVSCNGLKAIHIQPSYINSLPNLRSLRSIRFILMISRTWTTNSHVNFWPKLGRIPYVYTNCLKPVCFCSRRCHANYIL